MSPISVFEGHLGYIYAAAVLAIPVGSMMPITERTILAACSGFAFDPRSVRVDDALLSCSSISFSPSKSSGVISSIAFIPLAIESHAFCVV